MAYTTLALLRTYLGIADGKTDDDTLLTALLAQAQLMIEQDRNRVFEADTNTRYYDRFAFTGQELLVDEDLLTVTQLLNGDSASTEIASGNYWLLPRNETPYQVIRLKSGYLWQVDIDFEISVAGTWGYTATAPDDIIFANWRLAAYLYRNRDSQVFDVTADLDSGQLIIPKGMPADVRVILDRYPRRQVIG